MLQLLREQRMQLIEENSRLKEQVKSMQSFSSTLPLFRWSCSSFKRSSEPAGVSNGKAGDAARCRFRSRVWGRDVVWIRNQHILSACASRQRWQLWYIAQARVSSESLLISKANPHMKLCVMYQSYICHMSPAYFRLPLFTSKWCNWIVRGAKWCWSLPRYCGLGGTFSGVPGSRSHQCAAYKNKALWSAKWCVFWMWLAIVIHCDKNQRILYLMFPDISF
jgi:hypothetical protein